MFSLKGIKNKPLAVTVLLGVSAGFVNGLLGAGGGILVVLALKKILKKKGADEKDIFANSLAVMLPVSIFPLFSMPFAEIFHWLASMPLYCLRF